MSNLYVYLVVKKSSWMIEADVGEATTIYIILDVQFGFLEEISVPSAKNSHPSATLPPSHQRQTTWKGT